MIWRIGLLALGAVSLASCGGGSPSLAVPVYPATTYRSNVAGDSWLYNVSINFHQFGSYSGTLTEGLTNDTYNGSPSIRFTSTFNLNLQSGPSVLTSYEEIGLDGALLAETYNGALTAVTSDNFSTPNPIALGQSSKGVITLANGVTITENYNVSGAAEVQTPAGSYACWTIKQSAIQSTGTSDQFTMWLAPETGNFVKLSDDTANSDGTGYTYVATLASSTTAPSAAPGGPNISPQATRILGNLLKTLAR